jgi:hypothetical protein
LNDAGRREISRLTRESPWFRARPIPGEQVATDNDGWDDAKNMTRRSQTVSPAI